MNDRSTNDRSKEFNDFFNETYALYIKIITFALELENVSGVVEVSFINELRNVLYHLYGYLHCDLGDTKSFTKQYHAAREHLYRAYYDLFSLTCSTTIISIQEYEKTYSRLVIHKTFPDYFDRIKPNVMTVSKRLAEIKAKRDESSVIDSNLSLEDKIEFNDRVLTLLANYHNELISHTNLFEDYQLKEQEAANQKAIELQQQKELDLIKDNKDRRKTKVDNLIKIAVPLVAALLTFLLTYYFVVPKQKQPMVIPSKEIKKQNQ